ncbi:AP endonuclease [Laetiporus sulphureus 93-53]|uniref:Apurinic-apyrimidinic endonuclease 1 n=1 Tax=Laetiporus sulphureus 93-53 TaxID=1314785 RepID=A0A165C7Z2_9APHY|nr:AP endonuclease [Laetiporus sulphureus 93-53]KZT02361.1 AP endonuclease [Laetiporus sulphureus 93-53]
MSALPLRRSTRLASAARVLTAGKAARNSVKHTEDTEAAAIDSPRPAKRARKAKTRTQVKVASEDSGKKLVDDVEDEVPKPKRVRPKAVLVEPVPTDFAPRAVNAWKIGPHVSGAGGVENTIVNAAAVGANAFAVFVKSQRKWVSSPLTSESIASFKSRMKAFGYSPSHILPHGSYLINLGNPDEEKREKSYQCFLDDLKRCEELGLHLYNFHPGSSVGRATTEESLSFIAECINRAHEETKAVVIILENMAGAGSVVGSHFSELGEIIKQVENKSRVGVCLDTCHTFAAGYDIRTKDGWNDTMTEFEREIGPQYLRGMHINDSKAALGSKKDRHQNIGLGELGLTTFAHILSDPRTKDIPLILETPAFDTTTTPGGDVWRKEIEVLNRFSTLAKEKDADLEGWTAEIAAVVKKASVATDAKGRKVSTGKRKTRKRNAKKLEEGEEEEDSEDEESV